MKQLRLLLVATAFLTMLTAIPASAKHVQVPKMYMFGFAASFNDTIVHFTDIQEIDSTWRESKNKFLLGRERYSSQLRNFLKNEKAMPNRTCIVIYNTKRSKLEKEFLKMRKLYTKFKDGKQHFDVRYTEPGEFRFKGIDVSQEYISEEELVEYNAKPEAPAKKPKKNRKEKKK